MLDRHVMIGQAPANNEQSDPNIADSFIGHRIKKTCGEVLVRLFDVFLSKFRGRKYFDLGLRVFPSIRRQAGFLRT